jgi:hypothetical protein
VPGGSPDAEAVPSDANVSTRSLDSVTNRIGTEAVHAHSVAKTAGGRSCRSRDGDAPDAAGRGHDTVAFRGRLRHRERLASTRRSEASRAIGAQRGTGRLRVDADLRARLIDDRIALIRRARPQRNVIGCACTGSGRRDVRAFVGCVVCHCAFGGSGRPGRWSKGRCPRMTIRSKQ